VCLFFNCVRPFHIDTISLSLPLAGSYLPALDDAEQELSTLFLDHLFLLFLFCRPTCPIFVFSFFFFFMSYPLVSDLKCWISYHLSLDLHFAHILTLSYPPVCVQFSFFFLSFFCVNLVCIHTVTPFLISLVSRPLEASSDHPGNLGTGKWTGSAEFSCLFSCVMPGRSLGYSQTGIESSGFRPLLLGLE
jgi:hypothetical protein